MRMTWRRWRCPPAPDFDSDGCSGGLQWLWNAVYSQPEPPWRQCCIEHDWAYWNGGGERRREVADDALRDCIAANGSPGFAGIVWAAVRAFGWMHWGKRPLLRKEPRDV